ncbi:MAG: hypothetical protein LBF27_17790 [Sphingobacterium sp.]|jgi:hypothetical protein|nr:hypothetical protein [Sphingobacterium sp.]
MSTKQFIKNNKRWFSALALSMMVGIATAAYSFKGQDNDLNPKQEPLHWFQINGSYTDSQAVTPSNASYINSDATPPTGTGCSGTAYQCVSRFKESQTIVVGGVRMLNGSQIPESVASHKN